jgi:hypothetical protein
MNCNECLENLVPHLERLLGSEQESQLQAHLENCDDCRKERNAFALIQERLLSRGHARRSKGIKK